MTTKRNALSNDYTGDIPVDPKLKIKSVDINWVEGTFKGHAFCAKVFLEPSPFGIKNGRISKLQILKKGLSSKDGWQFENTLYNWDRGRDMHNKIGHELASLFDKMIKNKV